MALSVLQLSVTSVASSWGRPNSLLFALIRLPSISPVRSLKHVCIVTPGVRNARLRLSIPQTGPPRATPPRRCQMKINVQCSMFNVRQCSSKLWGIAWIILPSTACRKPYLIPILSVGPPHGPVRSPCDDMSHCARRTSEAPFVSRPCPQAKSSRSE